MQLTPRLGSVDEDRIQKRIEYFDRNESEQVPDRMRIRVNMNDQRQLMLEPDMRYCRVDVASHQSSYSSGSRSSLNDIEF